MENFIEQGRLISQENRTPRKRSEPSKKANDLDGGRGYGTPSAFGAIFRKPLRRLPSNIPQCFQPSWSPAWLNRSPGPIKQ